MSSHLTVSACGSASGISIECNTCYNYRSNQLQLSAVSTRRCTRIASGRTPNRVGRIDDVLYWSNSRYVSMPRTRSSANTSSPPHPATAESRRRWLILVHQLPATPSNLRVRTWRRLQELGAVAVKQAVYVLPDTAESREDFEWLKVEIEGSGGEALVFSADQVNASADATLIEEFRRARQLAYAGLGGRAPAGAARRAPPASGRPGAAVKSSGTGNASPPSSASTFSAVPAGIVSSPCWPIWKRDHNRPFPR